MMTVKKDLSSMSDREKRKLLMKESPELFGLITDFKSNYLSIFNIIFFKIRIYIICYILINHIITLFIIAYMGRVQEKLSPFLKLVRSGDLPKSRFTEYTQCYFEIILK